MDTISNGSLKLDANIYAMNQAKKLPELVVGKLLESASVQQTQVMQEGAKQAAEATGRGINFDSQA